MDKIAVLDFGGQYAHLIANRIRKVGVYTEIFDGEVAASELESFKGVVLSGGPASTIGPNAVKCDPRIFELGIPVLGICYGHQLIAVTLNGKVAKGVVPEYGHAAVEFEKTEGIVAGVQGEENVWMSHFDQVVEAPEGFEVLGKTKDCPIAVMSNEDRKIYSLQFHPEVTHTPCGMRILENFVEKTEAERTWSIDSYIEEIVEEIREKVGERKVFLMISGGVDSTVAFLLLSKALGPERVYGLFVDTGFMRLGEVEEVSEALRGLGVNLRVVDASEKYFEALKGIYEPEEKRKIIGDLFLEIREEVSEELELNPEEWLLGQGTIYPDTIETGGTKHADKIKTHHNRVDKVLELMKEGKVIEPIAQLYKDEVREVGRKLGLIEWMVERHPFPGPGLAVRILCSEGANYPDGYEASEKEIAEIVGEYGLKAKILPINSVGVQGDERTYRNPVVLYGNDEVSWDDLDKLSTTLTNKFSAVNRVLYGLMVEGIENVGAENVYLTRDRVANLQKADDVVMRFIKSKGVQKEIWQFPTVMIPLSLEGGKECVVLRPVESTEAMTANFYRMDRGLLGELKQKIRDIGSFSGVFYDITNKPPGTIEWE